jgi:hypothetical protein
VSDSVADTPPLIDPLLVQILEANSNALNYTTNALIEGYKHSSETYCATVDAIRDHVHALLNGPYMPTSAALLSALYPSEEMISRYMRSES